MQAAVLLCVALAVACVGFCVWYIRERDRRRPDVSKPAEAAEAEREPSDQPEAECPEQTEVSTQPETLADGNLTAEGVRAPAGATAQPELAAAAEPGSAGGATVPGSVPCERVMPEPERLPTGQQAGRRRRIDPERRGGRSRDSRDASAMEPDALAPAQDGSSDASPAAQPDRVRAELVTWSVAGTQHVGLEISSGNAILSVRYESGMDLPVSDRFSAAGDPVYLVTRMEPVVVETHAQKLRVVLSPDDVILFKLHGEKGALGRRVKYASHGRYVLVCPSQWTISGPAVREHCSVAGCTAYVLECAAGSETPVLVSASGGQRALERRLAYRIHGNIYRSPTDPRPLCMGEAPALVAPEPFRAGTTVVVGGEAKGSMRKWRRKLACTPGSSRLELSSALDGVDGGWFFARVYENDDELLDSLDFLFLRPVKSVEVSPHPVFPGPGGHSMVRVAVAHDEDIEVTVKGNHEGLAAVGQRGLTIVDMPPDPARDEVFLVVERSGKVFRDAPIRIADDRAWFGLGEQDKRPDSWVDRVLEVSREDFRPTKHVVVWVRLPRRLAGTPVMAGFDRSRAKKYPSSARSAMCAIPLRDFYDQPELVAMFAPSPSARAAALRLWHAESDDSCVVANASAVPSSVRVWRALGRSKNVCAVAFMRHPGDGRITCGGQSLDSFCRGQRRTALSLVRKILEDRELAAILRTSSVEVTLYGGVDNSVRRCKAVAHSIANVLKQRNPALVSRLKAIGLGGARPRKAQGFIDSTGG